LQAYASCRLQTSRTLALYALLPVFVHFCTLVSLSTAHGCCHVVVQREGAARVTSTPHIPQGSHACCPLFVTRAAPSLRYVRCRRLFQWLLRLISLLLPAIHVSIDAPIPTPDPASAPPPLPPRFFPCPPDSTLRCSRCSNLCYWM
jgi:hypothetical protein